MNTTPNNIIDIPILNDIDQFDRNRERADNNGNEHCPCCGREIKSPKFFINSIYGGKMYPSNDQQEYNDAWVMGVGSECRKKLPNGYVFQIEQ